MLFFTQNILEELKDIGNSFLNNFIENISIICEFTISLNSESISLQVFKILTNLVWNFTNLEYSKYKTFDLEGHIKNLFKILQKLLFHYLGNFLVLKIDNSQAYKIIKTLITYFLKNKDENNTSMISDLLSICNQIIIFF